MSSVLHDFSIAELLLMSVVLYAFVRSKERRRFPALFLYFTLRLTSFVLLEVMMHVRSVMKISALTEYEWYFFTYWVTYIVCAIAVFFVIQELFNSAMKPLPGLMRLGSIAFRWVVGVSLVAAITAVLTPGVRGYQILVTICSQVMRCESIFILCLLLFLVVTAGKLGLSYRSRIFGVSFGFGIMAASNLVASALLINFSHSMTNSTSIMDTACSLFTLVLWAAYFVQKEPARGAAMLPVTSPLVRWNEIAMAIGAVNSRVTVLPASAPANDFFLQDVEKVVDRILTKNSLSAAS
jgi:hypothetical protein